MKIVAWIGDEPNQIALVDKLQRQFDVVGVVYENRSKKGIRSYGIKDFTVKLISRIFFSFISKTWTRLQEYYRDRYSKLDSVPELTVENINNDQVKKFTSKLNPDVIIVSGTRLIKKENLRTECKHGILNLHTGLSPFVKGGPNCTNWCLSTGKTHLIGNSIMWIDEGIDSGNLLITEQTPLDGNESFFTLHLRVMEHAHEIYFKALKSIENGHPNNLPQTSLGNGKTYYNKDWNLAAQFNLTRNLKQYGKLHSINKEKDVETTSY